MTPFQFAIYPDVHVRGNPHAIESADFLRHHAEKLTWTQILQKEENLGEIERLAERIRI